MEKTVDSPPDQSLLQRAARRASQCPFFLASAFSEFQSLRGLDEEGLARWLGCPMQSLVKLALCRRPDGASPRFRAEIEQIATYGGACPVRLAQLIREVDSVAALRCAPSAGGHGVTMAARDHAVSTDVESEQKPESDRSTKDQQDSPDG